MAVRENSPVVPGSAARGEAEILSTRTAWENEVARLLVDRVRLPGHDGKPGGESEHFRLVHGAKSGHGVVVVPVEPDGRIVLLRQFRHPARMWIRELPRGSSEPGELPADAARRELEEELGLLSGDVFPLGRVVNDSGQLGGVPHLVVAMVTGKGDSEREASELVNGVFRYTFDELRRACWRGDVIDSFTLCAVARLAPHFGPDGRFAYRPEEVGGAVEPEPE